MPAATAELDLTLKRTFGYATFRPLQREICEASLAGKDVFALLPTGGGKSLCFQLPALVRDGLTVVVSPLIALMKDQVDQLQASGVAATFLNSTLADDERKIEARDPSDVEECESAQSDLGLRGTGQPRASAGVHEQNFRSKADMPEARIETAEQHKRVKCHEGPEPDKRTQPAFSSSLPILQRCEGQQHADAAPPAEIRPQPVRRAAKSPRDRDKKYPDVTKHDQLERPQRALTWRHAGADAGSVFQRILGLGV